jgi:hypothetical protein
MQVTDLTNPDGFVVSEPRLESNSAEDFLEFVMLLLLRGVFRAGDYVICDNAPIHYSEDIEAALEAVLEASQVCCFHCLPVFIIVALAGPADLSTVLQSRAQPCRAPVRHG